MGSIFPTAFEGNNLILHTLKKKTSATITIFIFFRNMLIIYETKNTRLQSDLSIKRNVPSSEIFRMSILVEHFVWRGNEWGSFKILLVYNCIFKTCWKQENQKHYSKIHTLKYNAFSYRVSFLEYMRISYQDNDKWIQ